MADITYPELEGEGGEGLVPMARAAREGFCAIYRAAPGWLLAENLPDPLAFGSDALMRRICPPPLAPPPPEQPFGGGQCPVQYSMRITTNRNINGNIVPEVVTRGCGFQGGNEIFGPVGRPFIDEATGSVKVPCRSSGGVPREVGMSNSSAFPIENFRVDFLTRCDNQPDNCGVIYPRYDDPTPPPPDLLDFNVDIDIGGVNVTVPFTFAPTLYRPDIDITPTVVVNVGGVDFNFNAGGVDVNIPIGTNPPPGGIVVPPGNDPRPNPPPPKDPNKPPAPPEVDLSPVIDKLDTVIGLDELAINLLDRLQDCDRCRDKPLTDPDYEILFNPAEQSGIINLQPSARFIVLLLNQVPGNAKTQAGGNAPKVYYAGWCAFAFNGNVGERSPIHYFSNCRSVPPGADAFTYTLPIGYTGSILVFNKQDL